MERGSPCETFGEQLVSVLLWVVNWSVGGTLKQQTELLQEQQRHTPGWQTKCSKTPKPWQEQQESRWMSVIKLKSVAKNSELVQKRARAGRPWDEREGGGGCCFRLFSHISCVMSWECPWQLDSPKQPGGAPCREGRGSGSRASLEAPKHGEGSLPAMSGVEKVPHQ